MARVQDAIAVMRRERIALKSLLER